MLNMDEVNLTKSEWNHGEKIFEGGGHRIMFPKGYGILPRKIATAMISLSCSLYQVIPPFVIRYAGRYQELIHTT